MSYSEAKPSSYRDNVEIPGGSHYRPVAPTCYSSVPDPSCRVASL